jgi:hypothetical protein
MSSSSSSAYVLLCELQFFPKTKMGMIIFTSLDCCKNEQNVSKVSGLLWVLNKMKVLLTTNCLYKHNTIWHNTEFLLGQEL